MRSPTFSSGLFYGHLSLSILFNDLMGHLSSRGECLRLGISRCSLRRVFCLTQYRLNLTTAFMIQDWPWREHLACATIHDNLALIIVDFVSSAIAHV